MILRLNALRWEFLWYEVSLVVQGIVRPVREGARLIFNKGSDLAQLLTCL